MRDSLAKRLQIPANPSLSRSAQLRKLLMQAVGQLVATADTPAEKVDRVLLQKFLAAALVDEAAMGWYLRQLAIINCGKRLAVLPAPSVELIDAILADGLDVLPAEVFLWVAVDPAVIITCGEQMRIEYPRHWRSLIDTALEDLLTLDPLSDESAAVDGTDSEPPQPYPKAIPRRGEGLPYTGMLMSMALGGDDLDDGLDAEDGQRDSESAGDTKVDDE